METKTVSINLYGRVQRVGFRYFVFRLAAELGVKGFVKNMSDGSVYVEVESDPHTVDVFITHCKMGPPHSTVTNFTLNTIPFKDFKEFSIR